jgi:hypothetical protein
VDRFLRQHHGTCRNYKRYDRPTSVMVFHEKLLLRLGYFQLRIAVVGLRRPIRIGA